MAFIVVYCSDERQDTRYFASRKGGDNQSRVSGLTFCHVSATFSPSARINHLP